MTGELRLPFFGKEKHMATNSMGTTLQFTPSGGTQVTVGKLSSIGELSPDSEELDVTTLDATGGYREYIQGLRDAGELEIEGYHNAGDNGQAALRAAYASGDCGSFVITFPDNTTAAFSAFVKLQFSLKKSNSGFVKLFIIIHFLTSCPFSGADLRNYRICYPEHYKIVLYSQKQILF